MVLRPCIIARGDRARELSDNPVYIRNIDHRMESHYSGSARSHDVGVDQSRGGQYGVGDGPIDVAELSVNYSHEEIILREALGLLDHDNVNPSGGPLARSSRDGDGPHPRDRGRAAHQERCRQSGVAHASSGAVSSAKSGLRVGREQLMAVPCAVIGIGQTNTRAPPDVSLEGLVREAVLRALDDAELTFKDIDAIVVGKAPDALEGVMMPELSLADAIGAVGKPVHRVHTAGSVGASTAVSGVTLVESGRYERVLVVCYEKQSEGNATWALSGVDRRSRRGRHVRSVDPQLHPAVQGTRAHRLDGGRQGPQERAQEPVRALAPEGHLDREGQRVPDAVGPAALPRVVPVVRRRARGRARRRGGRQEGTAQPAWVIAHAKRTEFGQFPGRDTVKPQAGVDCAASSTRRRHHQPAQADRLRRAVRAVLLVRADVARRPPHRREGEGGR
jgi:hypothetical protein